MEKISRGFKFFGDSVGITIFFNFALMAIYFLCFPIGWLIENFKIFIEFSIEKNLGFLLYFLSFFLLIKNRRQNNETN